MVSCLTLLDSDMVQVALNALENILKAGEKFPERPNPYAMIIEEYGGEHGRYNLRFFFLKFSHLFFDF